MNYRDSGVVYSLMDPYKRAAQLAARETAENLDRHGCAEIEWTRGESVYVVHAGPNKSILIGFVVEGLGTKNVVPERVRQQSCIALRMSDAQRSAFIRRTSAVMAIDNAAMVFNDMATLGIRPVVFGQHLASGDSNWFQDVDRWQGYIDGTVESCNKVGCCWGCGETPTLKGIIVPGMAELSGASWGTCTTAQFIGGNIQDGDRIFIFPSTGVHANGLTLCRDIAEGLPSGYFTLMDNGETFGEGLLKATALYGPVVETCQKFGARIHYAVNVTGHGWRKLMRAPEPFVYVIERIPSPQPVFGFIQKHGQVSLRDMYADFNMGAGFAVFVPQESADAVRAAAATCCTEVLEAGHIEKRGNQKMVSILSIGEYFKGEELAVR